MATELVRHTFRLTVEVTISVEALDDERVQRTKARFHNEVLAADPHTALGVARDRRLLAALLAHPEELRRQLLRHLAWELDPIRPTQEILADLDVAHATDAALVEALQEALPPDDVAFLRDVCTDDLFDDNTSFFQDAFAVEVGRVRIGSHTDEAAGEEEEDA